MLETPLLNKGSAFSRQERIDFNLTGLLPTQYETILEQADRAYSQYCKYHDAINKHIYLRGIQDNNETLFYALVSQHLEEMMPIIYTPTVGDACEQFSDIYRSSRGLFLAWEERGQIDDILRNATKDKVKVIVVTDGERILGLGDQGIGGMGIPIGKLSLYTACGGISPAYTLPVMLDVGTNNENLLSDPMYMGARHPRVSENEYDEFIELFMHAAERRWPGVLIQFEDFAQANAMPVLNRYRERFCCFNDDIQGTAAVSLGTLLAACRVSKKPLKEQRIAFVGAGSAGCGIAEMLIRQMINEGLSDNDARRRILIDRHGLITEGMSDLQDFQCRLAQRKADIAKWSYTGEWASLEEVVAQARPTILIGVSGQPGLFTEPVIKTMAQNNESPIIFPLSNPVSRAEATAENIIRWTDGKAIIAHGEPLRASSSQRRVAPDSSMQQQLHFSGHWPRHFGKRKPRER